MPLQLARLFLNHRYLLFATVLLFCAGAARAQTDFRPGYVVLPAGDTLRGEVDYRDGRFSSQRCRFRSGSDGAVVVYEPSGLRAYGLTATGQTYRAVVPPAAPIEGASEKSFFLEVLAEGAATLYFLRDDNGRDHFYLRSPTLPLAELQHEVQDVQIDGRTYRKEQNWFRTPMSQAFAGCPAVQQRVLRVLYRESDLRRAVTAYNVCIDPKAAVVGPKAHSQTSYGLALVAGIQRGVVLWNDYYFPEYRAITKSFPTFGAELEVRNSRFSRRVSLVLGALYSSQSLKDASGTTPFITTELNQKVLAVPVLTRYTFPNGKLRPVFELGLSGTYTFTKPGTSTRAAAPGLPPYATTNVQYGNEGANFALLGGVGVSTYVVGGRALSVRVRLEKNLSEVARGGNSFSYYGLLSYQLFK